jgi:hypothetical protein
MFTRASRILAISVQAVIELDKQCGRAISRTLLAGVFVGTIYMLAQASAVFTGGWSDAGPRGLALRAPSIAHRSHSPRRRKSVCRGIKVARTSDLPPGYTLIYIRRLGKECFMLLKTEDGDASPAPGLGGGMADVFGRDGRLIERFFAIRKPNVSWQILEYRRLPVGGMQRARTQG